VIDSAAPAALLGKAGRLFARLGEQRMKEGYFTTFWLPSGAPPAHAFEELAISLSAHGLRSAGERAREIAGLEWWLGRSYTNHIPLGFHFDLDVKGRGAVRFPIVSSVFFFNSVRGGQLAITDQLPDAKSRPTPAQPTQLEAIAPEPNRYALFDGRRYHGVLDANGHVPGRKLPGPRGAMRRTLVINYWAARPAEVPTWAESRAYRALRAVR
jgi:hypothetical protein